MQILLITGFLGSGKTTLLTNLLQEFNSEKIGIIMNEFSEVGIDGTLINNNNLDIIELNNGSIFCACIKENFIQAIVEFTKHNIDYLFIESSGLADPSNMDNIVEVVLKLSNREIHYSGAICILDALYFLQQFNLLPSIKRQIEYSGAVIINKTDLQGEEKIKEICSKVSDINFGINIYKTSYCKVNIREIVHSIKSCTIESKESTNTRETRPKTLVLQSDEILNFDILQNFIKEIKGDSFRIKGFANTNKGLYQINSVNKQLEIIPWNKTKENTKLVVISSVGIKIISTITNAQKVHFGRNNFSIK